MKVIFADYCEDDGVIVQCFGMEEISENAHWGSGGRNEILIHYVLTGEGYFNGIRIGAGEGFYIPRMSKHEYHSSDDKPWTYFWISLSGEEADKVCRRYLNVGENGIFCYPFVGELNALCEKMFDAYSEIGCAKAMEIFYMLMAKQETEGKRCPNKYTTAAKKYMDRNFYRGVTVCEVARSLYISDRYLYNLFIKYEGISPKKYLNELRLKQACEMLTDGNYSYTVTEIAVSVGFNDVLTFSRFFSTHMKLSPLEYRKRHE